MSDQKTKTHIVSQTIQDYITQYNAEFSSQNALAIAVSGGPDSMALAHSVIDIVPNKQIHLITVDHGLRKEALAEAQAVGTWVSSLNKNNVQHKILTWQGDKPDTALMENARNARYDLMAHYCKTQNIRTLFVAHHLDDQAETFLIRLAKGSGLDGLAAMKEHQDLDSGIVLARPFLGLLKSDLIEYCGQHELNVVQDPSNENDKYLRPRLRQSMAVLSEEGLTPKRLATLSSRLRRARNALELLSDKAFEDCLSEQTTNKITLDFEKLQSNPEEIAFRVVHISVKKLRNSKDYGVRMERLEDLFSALWLNSENFKPRTLGGLIFALDPKSRALYIKLEK